MFNLDFAALHRIEEALTAAALEDLIAVFSQPEGSRLLLVYNTAHPPQATVEGCEVISLNDLGEADLTRFELFAGVSALDVIRPDLVTKGPGFFPLERIFLTLGQRPALHRTLHNLARFLVTFMDDLPGDDPVRRQRAGIKALQLALPALSDAQGVKDLVAVLPGADLAAFIAGEAGRWLRATDDLSSLSGVGPDDWLVTLEELRCFTTWGDSENYHFVSLRPALRRAGQAEALRAAGHHLASRWMAEPEERGDNSQTAWALMTERWLAEEDTEDLVAFFPPADFGRFAQTGAGLRVYLTLDEEEAHLHPGPRWSLADLATRGIPGEYRDHGFCLFPLTDLLGAQAATTPVADLGPVLWQADHDMTLATTLWELAQDGLGQGAIAANLSNETLLDFARRAVALIGMGDPWAWRDGRYGQMSAAAYQTLDQALQRQAGTAGEMLRDYYLGLSQWYGCTDAAETEIEDRLRQMAVRLRAFQRSAAGQAGTLTDYLDEARHLIEVEQAILYPQGGFKPDHATALEPRYRPVPDERGRLLSLAARRGADARCLSSLFRRAWEQIIKLRAERQAGQIYERNPETLQRRLERLLARVRQQQRTVALPHESAVLKMICGRESAEIEAQLRTLTTEARFQITPQNPYLDFGRPVDLVCELSNVGRVEAQNVDVILTPSKSYEVLDSSPVREFVSLPPGAPQRFTYRVQAVQATEASFDFRCTYAGKSHALPLRLPVRRAGEAPFVTKGDPYKFGRAIQSPDDFYGREAEIKLLLASLYSGGETDFLLRGPRRMGKTSLMHMLKHTLETPALRRRFDIPIEWDATLDRLVPIRLDLQGFYLEDNQAHIRRFFQAVLDQVSAALAPDRHADLLRNYELRQQQIDPPRALLEQLADIFSARPGMRAVVLLDEYDEVYHPQGRGLDTALRYIIQEEQRLTWVIASTLALYKEGKSYGSPWFNIFNIIELGCLSREAAQKLVEVPSRGQDVGWQSDAIVALLDETGRHPAFLQLFCSRVMAYLNRERENYVLPNTIATLADEIVEERETLHSHFEFYWADTPGVGQLILLAADAGDHLPTRLELQRQVYAWLLARFGRRPMTEVLDGRPERVPWREREFADGMTWVEKVVNAISFDRAARTCSFTVPLFRRWLQRRGRYEDLQEAALSKVGRKLSQDDIP